MLRFAVALAASLAFSDAQAEPHDYEALVKRTPGLLVYLRLEEQDERVGGDVHSVASAFAPLGRAVKLNGGHLRLPDLGTHDAVTVEFWLKLAQPAGGGIAALYAADKWEPGFLHLNLRAGGAVEFALNGAGAYPHSEPDTIPLGRWIHLAATYDRSAGQQRLFRDGRIVKENVLHPRPAVKLVAGAFGTWFTGGPTRPLLAEIDEAALYSVALTPAQVRSHYLAGRGIELTPVDFARDVRPILEQQCFACHGTEKQENGLRLDIRDAVLRGGESGEPAVAPYDAEGSYLIRRISSRDADVQMPPEGPRLADAQLATLKNWIDQGAPWPAALAGKLPIEKVATMHWSFQPVKKVEPPLAATSAIDAFILAKLRENKIAPSPLADPRTLVRRLYLDVHGLPPSPEEVQRFAADPSQHAWEALVDEVLASPRYGERWASHWLDVIRYGDTHGFEVNTPRDNAWPYRDYVIRSLNEDKPYNRFLREQIAGDQLEADAATGFLVAAPALLQGQVGKDMASIRQARQDELHEAIVSVSAGVLGLTVGCARCHNHKFDPISQRDYYQMQAMFAGLRYGERPLRSGAAKVVFAGLFTTPEATHRLYRGDPMQRRERVAPAIPAVFGNLTLEAGTPEPERRLALADWLVNPANPLTARVIVNRVWQHHFGTGLVATPSDFGAMGVAPTHPELLDWLAATLVEQGWSLKKLHRLILTSHTYRQASRPRADGLAADAGSRLLWRFPPRRLEMEPIRDSILAVSGALDLTMGGPGFLVFKPNTNYVRVYDPKEDWGPPEWRRMIYAHRVRMAQDGVFGAFDCPDAGQPAPLRSRSTTALQALNLLNSSFIKQQSEMLAQRASREAGSEGAHQVDRVFALAFARAPSADESSAAMEVAREFGLPAVCRAVFNSNEFLFLP